MMKRVAISGLGRIGRMVLCPYREVRPKDIELAAANDWFLRTTGHIWSSMTQYMVIESTDLFTKRELAAKHLEAGARRVIISTHSPDADVTIIIGL